MSLKAVVNWTALAILVAIACVITVSLTKPDSTRSVVIGLIIAVPLIVIIGRRMYGRGR